jgi:putative chitinase
VVAGLPSLNRMMIQAGVLGNPYREACLISTVNAESFFEYNIREIGDTREYGGRGFVQLTGKLLPDGTIMNYEPCGKWIGIDLVKEPDLAMDIRYSWLCLLWYWTKARPDCNKYADELLMGRVNAAIGYPIGDGKADAARCANAARWVKHRTGETVVFNCDRKATL